MLLEKKHSSVHQSPKSSQVCDWNLAGTFPKAYNNVILSIVVQYVLWVIIQLLHNILTVKSRGNCQEKNTYVRWVKGISSHVEKGS